MTTAEFSVCVCVFLMESSCLFIISVQFLNNLHSQSHLRTYFYSLVFRVHFPLEIISFSSPLLDHIPQKRILSQHKSLVNLLFGCLWVTAIPDPLSLGLLWRVMCQILLPKSCPFSRSMGWAWRPRISSRHMTVGWGDEGAYLSWYNDKT